MNRILLRQLADERVRDASGLINVGQWSGAYHLTGFAVECGLKACIARLTNQDDYPDRDFVVRSYTHRIDVLVELAGMESNRKATAKANPAFGDNWLIVKDWDEKSRYKLWSESEARDLYRATTDPNDGVLPWIKAHW